MRQMLHRDAWMLAKPIHISDLRVGSLCINSLEGRSIGGVLTRVFRSPNLLLPSLVYATVAC